MKKETKVCLCVVATLSCGFNNVSEGMQPDANYADRITLRVGNGAHNITTFANGSYEENNAEGWGGFPSLNQPSLAALLAFEETGSAALGTLAGSGQIVLGTAGFVGFAFTVIPDTVLTIRKLAQGELYRWEVAGSMLKFAFTNVIWGCANIALSAKRELYAIWNGFIAGFGGLKALGKAL
ncbi:MAG: hypothetical protein LBF54_01380 [Holosporaceae bacterium]|nr:hypothetical protein [Holosporaceae bacterium]